MGKGMTRCAIKRQHKRSFGRCERNADCPGPQGPAAGFEQPTAVGAKARRVFGMLLRHAQPPLQLGGNMPGRGPRWPARIDTATQRLAQHIFIDLIQQTEHLHQWVCLAQSLDRREKQRRLTRHQGKLHCARCGGFCQGRAQIVDFGVQAQAKAVPENCRLDAQGRKRIGALQKMYEPGRHETLLERAWRAGSRQCEPDILYVKLITLVIVVITNVIAFPRPITNVNTFGSRLRHARALRQLTQAQLARACGLSQGAIGNYESDRRHNPKDVFRIAEALDVEAAWLAMGTPPMERTIGSGISEGAYLAAPAWPFPGVDPARIWALSVEQRQMLARVLDGMVTALEDEAGNTHA